MHHESRLLLHHFYRHKAHRWTPNRLADRFSVGHVMFVAFYIGFHIGGRHQTRFMAKRNQLARPMTRRRAGFQPDEAWRNFPKESEALSAPQSLAQYYAACLIDRMNLEN